MDIGDNMKAPLSGRISADARRAPGARGSLDIVRRISAEVSRAMHTAPVADPNFNHQIGRMAHRLSVEVSRISKDAHRPGRKSEVTKEIFKGPGDSEPVKVQPHGEGLGEEELFVPSHGITSAAAEELLKQWGRNELVEKTKPTWKIIFELVSWPPIHPLTSTPLCSISGCAG
jgi:hypothetical protein